MEHNITNYSIHNFEIKINEVRRSLKVEKDTNLSWAIYQTQSSTIQIPAHKILQSPLWVLVNSTNIINADKSSIFNLYDSSIITIQYALEKKYFREIFLDLVAHGVVLHLENIALIVFSMHVWLTQSSLQDLNQKISALIEHYPQYISQPSALTSTFVSLTNKKNTLSKYAEELSV